MIGGKAKSDNFGIESFLLHFGWTGWDSEEFSFKFMEIKSNYQTIKFNLEKLESFHQKTINSCLKFHHII